MFVIHYHKTTGQISQWGDGDSETSHFPDHEIARLQSDATIDPALHKVDLEYLCVIDKTLAEKLATLLPVVNATIRCELAATDAFMALDRPVSDTLRAAWITYRQALRDLSKNYADAASMIRNWPSRPDGGATHLPLVERLASIEC